MSFELLAIIVLLNTAAIIVLWRKAVNRPEKPKKKFLNRLWYSEPITPKHQLPPPLKKDEYGVLEGFARSSPRAGCLFLSAVLWNDCR
jgi:hypothetical protein